MFYRAPVLLRSSPYFLNPANQAVKVTTVNTVQLFDPVEVSEAVVVDDDIVATFHPGDTVNSEAAGMIDGNHEIHK